MADWKCAKCGCSLPDDQPGIPCASCGAKERSTSVVIEESIEVLPSMRSQKKVPSFPRGKKIRVDQFDGWEVRKALGDMVRKLRRIDKDADTYQERVTDRDGNVIHDCQERLSEHRGHGSAKKSGSADK